MTSAGTSIESSRPCRPELTKYEEVSMLDLCAAHIYSEAHSHKAVYTHSRQCVQCMQHMSKVLVHLSMPDSAMLSTISLE